MQYTHAPRVDVPLAQARPEALEVRVTERVTDGASGWLPRPPAGYPVPQVHSAIAVVHDLSAALVQRPLLLVALWEF